jgi:uncharacterized protein (DUF2384 family)
MKVIESAMLAKKFDIDSLAKASGVSTQTIRRAIRRGAHLTLSDGRRVARVLGVKSETLFEETNG